MMTIKLSKSDKIQSGEHTDGFKAQTVDYIAAVIAGDSVNNKAIKITH